MHSKGGLTVSHGLSSVTSDNFALPHDLLSIRDLGFYSAYKNEKWW